MISQRIKNGINKILFTSFVLSLSTSLAFSQAAILLQGVTQFFDNNGNPLTGGFVYTYVPPNPSAGLKTTWKDPTALIPNTNPIVLDSAGRAVIFGEGTYYEVVNDINNNLIWEGLTTPGAASNSGNIGDGLLVGSILPWSGLTAPNQYMFAAAQAVSRTTFSVLYNAITLSVQVTCANGNATVTGLTDTTNISISSTVEIPCISGGTATVVSKSSSSVTLSATANESASVTAIFYPYGNGDGSTTFNLPDLRGNTMYGNNNMGGTAGTRLTTTFALVNPNALGAVVGGQSHTQSIGEMPSHNHGGATGFENVQLTAVFNASRTAGSPTTGNQIASGSGALADTPTAVINNDSPNSHSHSISAQGGGSAFTLVTPGITINYVIKVTPDVSGSSVSGVASIGGMQGVIACGTGLLCTGNTISVNGGNFANPTASVGLTAVNGSALTQMRSDAAPALSQSIVPTWTGLHTFNGGAVVTTSFTATGLVTNADLANSTFTLAGQTCTLGAGCANYGAATILGNPTASGAAATAFTIQGQSDISTPNTTLDWIPIFNHTTGTIQKVNASELTSAVGSGVTSFGSLTGVITTGNGLSCSGSVCVVSLSIANNVLGSDTVLNNTSNYFDGPSTNCGSACTTGTWRITSLVTLQDTAAPHVFFNCKLWDGTTIISSGRVTTNDQANSNATMALSGYLASPAANIKVSCNDPTTTTGLIKFNASGNSKDSSIWVERVQ